MIIIVQPAIPNYRFDFFERVAQVAPAEVRIYYSPESLGKLTHPIDAPWAHRIGPIRKLPGGLLWQSGAASLPVRSKDIVVLSGNPRLLTTLLLLAKAKVHGAKVIWWGHFWSSTSRRWRQLLRFLPMSLANAVLLYTDEEVSAYQDDPARLNKRGRVAGLNNGLNLAPIDAARANYDAKARDSAVLFIGRLTEKCRLDVALDALARLGPAGPKLHVIGEGDQEARFRARAEELGLNTRVVWHGALTDEPRIAEIANRARLFLYPGEVGLSLIHGMAYGLPAIVHGTRRKHMPEIAAFRDSDTGEAFEMGNAEDLARVLAGAFCRTELLNRYSRTALSVVGPSFSTQDMARRFIALINELGKAV